MRCAHCAMSCTAKGQDMSQKTFDACLALAANTSSMVTLGGGEPTLHPLFKNFLMQAVWELTSVSDDTGCTAIHVITNGSKTDIAINLARLARQGVISAEVSQDRYHAPIDERVVKAFTFSHTSILPRNEHDFRGIRNTSKNGTVIAAGRAKKLTDIDFNGDCICSDLFVTPDGSVYPCGCLKTKLGHISKPTFDWYSGGECENSTYYREWLQEKTDNV